MQALAEGVRLGELARLVDGEVLGDADRLVHRLAPLSAAGPMDLTFLAQPRLQPQLASCAAAGVIVAPALREAALALQPPAADGGAATARTVIVCADPYVAYARLSQWWAQRLRVPVAPGVHRAACVEEGAEIGPQAHVGALAYVGRGARIGAGARVDAHAHVGDGAVIGERSRLAPRAMLLDGCRLGRDGMLHGGAVIGADGFGFAPHEGRWEKIEQLGAVRLGDAVEIGANTCIDRGALEDTVIEDGVKIDNLVQIGHNVHVGAHTLMAGCVGVAGSARIGRHCTIGGAALVLGHLEIADHTVVTAATVVSRSIRRAGLYSGAFPFDDNAAWEKNAATIRQLHALRERLRALERQAAMGR